MFLLLKKIFMYIIQLYFSFTSIKKLISNLLVDDFSCLYVFNVFVRTVCAGTLWLTVIETD